jgi:hypothetical protein
MDKPNATEDDEDSRYDNYRVPKHVIPTISVILALVALALLGAALIQGAL